MIAKSEKVSPFADFVYRNTTKARVGISNRTTMKLDPGENNILGVPRRSVAMLTNHCAIREVFRRAAKKFDMIYDKRAWV